MISGTAEVTEGPFAIAFGTVPWAYSIAPGESVEIHVRAIPEEMGEFTGRLVFSTGEEVTMSCHTATNNAEGAEIAVYPSLVDFGYVATESSEYRMVTVQNIGTDILEGMVVATGSFTVSPDEYSLAPGETTMLTIEFHPDEAGDFEGRVNFSGGSGKSIALYGTSNGGSTAITDGIRINEAAPWNTWGIQDSYGSYSDWIELYNENEEAVDLGGWTLTDDPTNLTSYLPLPAETIIPAKGFLVVFASVAASTGGEFHTGFELDEIIGGHIGLYDPIGVQVYTMDYPAITRKNWSYAYFEETGAKTSTGSNDTTSIKTAYYKNISKKPNEGKPWKLEFKTSGTLLTTLEELIADPTSEAVDAPVLWCQIGTSILNQKTTHVDQKTGATVDKDIACDMSFEVKKVGGKPKLYEGLGNQTFIKSLGHALLVYTQEKDFDVLILEKSWVGDKAAGLTMHIPGEIRVIGLFIKANAFHDTTLVHEFGHYVGLDPE